ncbi:hypothetical protein O6H91_07G097800 [Diphasiastrum complanatum]|uniref:Uncharacterized protein n=1 Tax=Diphasiastrum complanatum TaxID=34168 RepID=A0ACC2D7T0_DIPCM|nr:hypothetical protein O6H91_07G097800 [Diphasiastrum complanatum]
MPLRRTFEGLFWPEEMAAAAALGSSRIQPVSSLAVGSRGFFPSSISRPACSALLCRNNSGNGSNMRRKKVSIVSGARDANPQGRDFFTGAALQCSLSCYGRAYNKRSQYCVARTIEESPEVETGPLRETCTNESRVQRIWLSDVVVKRKRPYFLNRQWTTKDLLYVSFMVAIHGTCLLAPFTFSWGAFAAFIVMYMVTGMLGITLSFHRNLSHKSFKLPKWLEYTFAYCGVLALQGDPLEWVSSHRYHHQHCDTPMDPHTPYEGFWHSHMGWLLDDQSTMERVGARSNIGDLEKDDFYKFIEKTYILHPILSAAALYALGGFPYIVWGVAVRAVWVYHITWAVNSASHVWGTQRWKTGDLSRNNWWVALLAFGEGWHNNHHAFEYSARHGLEWWELDPTWYCVRFLQVCGLATKVKLPHKEHIARLAVKAI